MRCQRKGGLSATTQVKVLSPEIINIALGGNYEQMKTEISIPIKKIPPGD